MKKKMRNEYDFNALCKEREEDKNYFNKLTRNNSYELTKIIVGVAYGTNVERVREVLKEAMKDIHIN